MSQVTAKRKQARAALRLLLEIGEGSVAAQDARNVLRSKLDTVLDSLVDFIDEELGERTRAKLEREAERAEELDGTLLDPL